MDAKKQASNEQEKLELILKDYEQEQVKTNKVLTDLVTAVNGLLSRVNSFEEKLDNQTITAPETDTKPVQHIVDKGIGDMKLMYANSLLKSRENNFQVFLKSDAKKWLVILIVCSLFLTYLYMFGLRSIGK